MFITFEGGDGCGKSTQQKLLGDWFRSQGREVVLCRDPGSTPLGDAVRHILLHGKELHIADRTEMFLFMAARCQMVEEIIRPALDAGKVVLSDRFLLSSFVYQGIAGGVPMTELETVGKIATAGIMPDMSIILDIPYEAGLERRRSRSISTQAEQDRMESKDEAYHRRVREGFLRLAEGDSSKVVLDATLPVEVIAQMVQEHITSGLSFVPCPPLGVGH